MTGPGPVGAANTIWVPLIAPPPRKSVDDVIGGVNHRHDPRLKNQIANASKAGRKPRSQIVRMNRLSGSLVVTSSGIPHVSLYVCKTPVLNSRE